MDFATLLLIVADKMSARKFDLVDDEDILAAVSAAPGHAWHIHASQPVVAGLRLTPDGDAYEFFIDTVIAPNSQPIAHSVAPADATRSQAWAEVVTALLRFWAEPYASAKRAA